MLHTPDAWLRPIMVAPGHITVPQLHLVRALEGQAPLIQAVPSLMRLRNMRDLCQGVLHSFYLGTPYLIIPSFADSSSVLILLLGALGISIDGQCASQG